MAASSSSSSQQLAGDGELILAACHGRPVTAYDAVSGHVVAEFPAPVNTSRHGLAVVAAPGAAAPFVAASHVCPVTGAGSVLLLHWWSRAPARSLPVPEPVAPLVAAPRGGSHSQLLAGGLSGRVHAIALPSGDVARSFRAHGGSAPVSCLELSDDGSLLVSGGYDGEVAVFVLLSVLDVDADADDASVSADLSLYRVPAHAAPVTCVACGRGGCDAVVATASMDGTCKVWTLKDGSHLRTLTLPCTAFSLTLDHLAARLFAGGSDGRVHVASLSPAAITSSSWHASGNTNAALVGVGMANGSKNLVTCTEDGEVSVWDIPSGLLLAASFRISGAVTDVMVIKKSAAAAAAAAAAAGDMVRPRDGGVGFTGVRDGEAWRRAGEVARMEQTLRESEVEKARSVELVEMAVGGYRRCLRLMLREVTATVAGGGRRPNDVSSSDGHVSD
ncbi:hypothetical protein OsI_31763 [Oryza sativa Indica Group]|uniref:Uncharacterized protein n=1 Tax=Oryza sativa subsp. indica TaxID=39946 RepID=A2Z2C9_ORYSI|nr:hypothetical protein OsI_31763 [Oryza sativa Indica Group]